MQRQESFPLVFVVDDDAITVRTLGGLLARAGFRIASAGTLATALQGIRTQHPDLILLDIRLPDGSGFDLCRTLQKEVSALSTPILFISAADGVPMKVALLSKTNEQTGSRAGSISCWWKTTVPAALCCRLFWAATANAMWQSMGRKLWRHFATHSLVVTAAI